VESIGLPKPEMPGGATKYEQPQRGKHPRSALFSDALRASNRYVTAKAVTHKAQE
jgi:hypothetical protein